MKNEFITGHSNIFTAVRSPETIPSYGRRGINKPGKLPEVLFITSYPPRECGIATYSQDLITALNHKFDHSFKISICPLESENEIHNYTEEVKYTLNTDHPGAFAGLAKAINGDADIRMVVIQHEFGFFAKKETDFRQLLAALTKPVIVVFHTVLPHPGPSLKEKVQEMSAVAESIIVMTRYSAKLLTQDYEIPAGKITVIPHGTHLVPHIDPEILKEKYKLTGKKILSTFGLLGSGKSIETTLDALPAIVEKHPDVLFLIIGKTHPTVLVQDGEKYRNMLKARIETLQLEPYVQFVNYFVPLSHLLEYLQLTDVYLFTSNDPNQAVSGTFSYAVSCGCPVVSMPIPHAREVLQNEAGIIIDFGSSSQLADAVITLLDDEQLRKKINSNALHIMASTAWENSAIAHAMLFEKIDQERVSLRYNLPDINLEHIKKLTTDIGMIQFSRISQPDIGSGYTLDDNARAMIAMCQHYELTSDPADIAYISSYFRFIKHCLQPGGAFLNYVDDQSRFTDQNYTTNLDDSNGRAIWALGYLVHMGDILPKELVSDASSTMDSALKNVSAIYSTRAMAFIIKGLYYRNRKEKSTGDITLIIELANRLVQMYRHEAKPDWQWFESYLTYANSILPEALLCAWMTTGKPVYKEIAKASFDFLLSKIFIDNNIRVISNKNWMLDEKDPALATAGGEQPIDVAYTILALHKFYTVYKNEAYLEQMQRSFNWFLGANHLRQIIYNPCTGGCYDGLEENQVNLNQGAESTVSYLMARLTLEKSLTSFLSIRRDNHHN